MILPYTLNHQVTKTLCTPDLLILSRNMLLFIELLSTSSSLTVQCYTEKASLHCTDMHCFGPYNIMLHRNTLFYTAAHRTPHHCNTLLNLLSSLCTLLSCMGRNQSVNWFVVINWQDGIYQSLASIRRSTNLPVLIIHSNKSFTLHRTMLNASMFY